eukprot:21778-Chlamydomonas_euryale.AAC.4
MESTKAIGIARLDLTSSSLKSSLVVGWAPGMKLSFLFLAGAVMALSLRSLEIFNMETAGTPHHCHRRASRRCILAFMDIIPSWWNLVLSVRESFHPNRALCLVAMA